MQLGQIGRPALGQVGVRLGDHSGRNVRELHQLGVGLLLAAQNQDRLPAGQHRVEALFPRPASAE